MREEVKRKGCAFCFLNVVHDIIEHIIGASMEDRLLNL
jgi:hypothetical protein